jgi:light-harvesting complex I chlorophyll a/b binding protein 1
MRCLRSTRAPCSTPSPCSSGSSLARRRRNENQSIFHGPRAGKGGDVFCSKGERRGGKNRKPHPQPPSSFLPLSLSFKKKKSSLSASGLSARRSARPSTTSAAAVPPAGNWLPGSDCPPYLASAPGSHGFDPLKLAETPANLQRFQEAELIHSRWAMLGVAGALVPEVLGFGDWVSAQDWVVKGGNATWLGVANPLGISTLVGIQAVLFAAAEGARGQEPDAEKRKYPGGSFDPLGWSKDANALGELKLKELKNGRLAMVAFIGFVGQNAATGKTPLAALSEHVANPWAVNVASA